MRSLRESSPPTVHEMKPIRDGSGFVLLMALMVAITILAAVASLCIGVYHVPVSQVFRILFSGILDLDKTWTDNMYNVVMNSRLPRTVAAITVGFALAVAGACYQGIFQNPLVSPDILGVTSGATVGAAAAIVIGVGYVTQMSLAFIGGIVAVSLCMLLPALMRKRTTLALVLSGIIVGGFLSSILGFIKYIATPETELVEITFWQMGSLGKVSVESLLIAIPVIAVCCAVLIFMGWRINAMSLSDRDARSLGVDVVKERSLVIVLATVVTAISVCISGTIGWIGLTMPHFARLLVGDDSSKVIPLAGVMSAAFLIVVDILARNLTGAEIPLSIITGFLGAPLFAALLIRNRSVE